MRALRLLGVVPLALLLYLLLLFLGLMSLSWNLIAMVLHPLLPEPTGLRVGRAGISAGYRLFWNLASACRMMRIDASCLDVL
ncbi:MAG: 1-acyl-sn-glycerol-3-phosphate acyltransferase, partial [Comamonadaceae bacterium]